MINVNQITAQLARMPDQALQQYASMHKNDPYTVSLALSESNRRKQMRDAAQGQQGMGEQPKVVDQGIAEMMAPPPQPQMPQAQAQAMPEDVGIGALPAPNMQGMAEGGIVAFGDGGDVPGYAGGALIDQIEAANQMALRNTGFPLTAAQRTLLEQRITSDIAEEAAGRKAGAAGRSFDPSSYRPPAAAAAAAAPAESALVEAARNREAVANQGVTRGDVRYPQGLTGTDVQGVPPAPGAGGLGDLGGGRPPADPRAPAVPEKGFAERLKAAMGENPDEDRFAKRREDITASAKAGAEEGLAKLKADQESEMSSMFKGKEERIGKREGELAKSKDTNTGMAFLEAGLAMMQSRGRGLAGIAEGAAVGTKQYASGIKDIRAAQEKLDDARDRMEELRQNQSSMNKREVRAEEKGIRNLVTQGQERALDGAEKAYGIKREDMRAAITSDIAVSQADKTRAFQAEQGGLDRASREKIASMPPAEIQKISLLGGGDFAKGYEIYKQEAAIPRLYEAYTKQASDPIAGAAFQAKFPTFEVFRAGMGGGGKILDIPDAAAGAVRTR